MRSPLSSAFVFVHYCLFVTALLLSTNLLAQPFKPDAHGYVSDPKFKAMLKAKGYQLCGAFEENSLSNRQEALVFTGNKWRNIDLNGKLLPVPLPEMEMAGEAYEAEYGYGVPSPPEIAEATSKHGLHRFGEKGRYGIIRLTPKETIVPPLYDEVKIVSPYVVIARKDGKSVLYSSMAGRTFTSSSYDDIQELTYTDFLVDCDGYQGIISYEGREVVRPQYDYIKSYYSYYLLQIGLHGKTGMMDEKGTVIVPPVYDYIDFNEENSFLMAGKNGISGKEISFYSAKGVFLSERTYTSCRYLSRGLYAVTTESSPDALIGFCNGQGKEQVAPAYSCVYDFSDSRAVVGVKTASGIRYGYIDTDAKLIIEPVYDSVSSFSSTTAIVKQHGLYGTINSAGTIELPISYQQLKLLGMDLSSDFGHASWDYLFLKDGKWGVANTQTKEVLPAVYDYISREGHLFQVKTGNLYGLADRNQKMLLPQRYETINYERRGIYSARRNGVTVTVDLYGGEVKSNL